MITEGFGSQCTLGVQHLLYMALVAVVNIFLIYAAYMSPTGIAALLVCMVYGRDSFYVVIRFLDAIREMVMHRRRKYKIIDENDDERFHSHENNEISDAICKNSYDNKNDNDTKKFLRRNVLCVLPTYKEEVGDVARTLDSLMMQKEEGRMSKRIIMVCDGFFDYAEVFSSMVLTDVIQYQTFRGKSITIDVFRAIYKSKDIVVIVKAENAGKKDSLILINKIFLHDNLKQLRMELLSIFKTSHFDYIFHTDADTVIPNDTLQRATEILTANPSVSAVAGLALVSEDFRFWSLYQGFEYYYEQTICRLTESCWKRPFILPGCITMVNLSHDCVVKASHSFQELPSSTNIFQINDRLQGTDRRYTNCLLQQSPNANLLTSDRLHCFTKPPNSLRHFLSQRKRWLSNAVSGYLLLLMGRHTPCHLRLLAFFELVHIHTSVARFFSCCVLILYVRQFNPLILIYICLLFIFPLLFTGAHACILRSYAWFLLIGCGLNVMVGSLLNMCVFVNCLLHFTSVSWGVSHGQK